MILKYSQLIKKPVVELKNQSKVGSVDDIILTKSNFKVFAMIVRDVMYWPPKRAITESDIVDIALEAVMIGDEDDVAYIKELPRVKEALENGFVGIGQKVVTKSKNGIGRVFDYTFDSGSGFLQKLYTKSMISERIIPRTAIVDYKDGKIIIEDGFEAIKETEPVYSPETA